MPGRPRSRAPSRASLAGLQGDPRVTGTVGYAETGDSRFISTAGDAAYVVVELDMTDEESVAAVDDIRAAIAPPAGYTYQLTGYGPITKDAAVQSEKDLQKAEVVSLPIAALVLMLVFASVVAAGMPLLVAGLAIPSSLALVWVVAQQVQMSIFVLNIATMLGLALAIDYSLFIVSRFREELRRGRPVGEAVERAVATSGKAVTFSGVAVAIGLSGLLLFAAPAIRSIGIAGALVVAQLGRLRADLPACRARDARPRVNALTLRGLRHRFRPVADGPEIARTSRWERVAHGVMRRPSRSSSRRWPSCSSPGHRSCASSRACPARTSTPPASKAATRTWRSRRSSRPARRPRSSSWPMRRARRPMRPPSPPSTTMPRRWPRSMGSIGSRARSRSTTRPPGRPAAGPGRRHVRAAARAAARGSGCAAGAVRPGQHGPPRRDQPAATVAAGGDRSDPGDPGDRRRCGHHHAGRRIGGDRLRLPRVAGGARAVCRRADAARERRSSCTCCSARSSSRSRPS